MKMIEWLVSFLKRGFIALIAVWFLRLDHNPLVRIEAKLGLSPSPIEKLFGVKSLFSGMTEGLYQLTHFNLMKSIESNLLSPLFFVLFLGFLFTGYRPRVKTKFEEAIIFILVVLLSTLVNIFN